MNTLLSHVRSFWKYHVHSFFACTRFLFAIANALTCTIGTIYLLGRGLPYTEIGLVWSVTLFFSTVLDFPTGNFADLHGRKTAYVLGVLSIGVGNFIFGLGDMTDKEYYRVRNELLQSIHGGSKILFWGLTPECFLR
jgi:MFS family permease